MFFVSFAGIDLCMLRLEMTFKVEKAIHQSMKVMIRPGQRSTWKPWWRGLMGVEMELEIECSGFKRYMGTVYIYIYTYIYIDTVLQL